jgi:hypothetical protein
MRLTQRVGHFMLCELELEIDRGNGKKKLHGCSREYWFYWGGGGLVKIQQALFLDQLSIKKKIN